MTATASRSARGVPVRRRGTGGLHRPPPASAATARPSPHQPSLECDTMTATTSRSARGVPRCPPRPQRRSRPSQARVGPSLRRSTGGQTPPIAAPGGGRPQRSPRLALAHTALPTRRSTGGQSPPVATPGGLRLQRRPRPARPRTAFPHRRSAGGLSPPAAAPGGATSPLRHGTTSHRGVPPLPRSDGERSGALRAYEQQRHHGHLAVRYTCPATATTYQRRYVRAISFAAAADHPSGWRLQATR